MDFFALHAAAAGGPERINPVKLFLDADIVVQAVIAGLILAMPITVSLKLVCQSVPELNRWAELMSVDWQSPAPAGARRPPAGDDDFPGAADERAHASKAGEPSTVG